MTELGLRERKKAATRALIVETSERLFSEEGFDAVTLERVADECVLSVRTVLRYFPTKESLALARVSEMFEVFKSGLDDRPGDVVSYWEDHVRSGVVDIAKELTWFRRHLDMIHAHPSLGAHYFAQRKRYEEALADALAEELVDDTVRPYVLAAMLVSANAAVVDHWYANRSRWDPDAFVAVAEFAAASLEGRFPRRTRSEGKRGARAG